MCLHFWRRYRSPRRTPSSTVYCVPCSQICVFVFVLNSFVFTQRKCGPGGDGGEPHTQSLLAPATCGLPTSNFVDQRIENTNFIQVTHLWAPCNLLWCWQTSQPKNLFMIWSPKFSSSRQQLIVTTGSCREAQETLWDKTGHLSYTRTLVRGGWLDIEFHSCSKQRQQSHKKLHLL